MIQKDKSLYLVFVENLYIRKAEILDTTSLSEDEFDNFYYEQNCYEGEWQDLNPVKHYVGYAIADSPATAIKKVAADLKIDWRILYAQEISPFDVGILE